MTQNERLDYLLKVLLMESGQYQNISIPRDLEKKQILLRSLFNVRPPLPISNEFIAIQDDYLSEELLKKGITDLTNLTPMKRKLYLWQGDITTLKVDGIVNAANSQMLGCFVPCHGCIDNAIHTFAGIQLRLECSEIMKRQGRPEPTGSAKITKAYNLPSTYVLHTVGPIINGNLKKEDCKRLESCYLSCLNLAQKEGLQSIAFCCISTGEFHFPNEIAAQIAIKTVMDYLKKYNCNLKVVFNVYKDKDYSIYHDLLV